MNETVKKLNELLASLSLFYQNIRCLHWNLTGENFFPFHKQLNDLYDDVADDIDTVAERLRAMNFIAEHRFTEYLKQSAISEINAVGRDQDESAKLVILGINSILTILNSIRVSASDNEDYATTALSESMMLSYQKKLWMYSMIGSRKTGISKYL